MKTDMRHKVHFGVYLLPDWAPDGGTARSCPLSELDPAKFLLTQWEKSGEKSGWLGIPGAVQAMNVIDQSSLEKSVFPKLLQQPQVSPHSVTAHSSSLFTLETSSNGNLRPISELKYQSSISELKTCLLKHFNYNKIPPFLNPMKPSLEEAYALRKHIFVKCFTHKAIFKIYFL